MVGDDVEEVADSNNPNSSGGLLSSNGIISIVRKYWGHEDYVPPIDRPQFQHIIPGYRNEWQEDNVTSLLEMFGLYAPPQKSGVPSSEEDGDVHTTVVVPMSFDNEPHYHTRHDQMMLQKYLSPNINSGGVKTKLTLLPCKDNTMDTANTNNNFAQESIDDTAGYENECTLPGNMSMNTLRAICQGSDAQGLKRDLAESDPSFNSRQTDERIRTKFWNADCRWAVSFADSDDKEEEKIDDGIMVNMNDLMRVDGINSSLGEISSEDAAKVLRHSTAINSSWTYFPGSANTQASPAVASSLGAHNASSTSTSGAAGTPVSTSNESLQMQRLQHQIGMLEKELNDPSSLRDRDGMYEELKMAKRELRGLKPWYKRVWG